MRDENQLNGKIDERIWRHIEEDVFPEYEKNESGHGLAHVKYVINRSFMFADTVENIDYSMVYVVAAYHDIGHHIDSAHHEQISADLLLADNALWDFFGEDDMQIMAQAVLDHRASLKTEPQSVYGKIVSSADRNTSVDDALKRAYAFRIEHSPSDSLSNIIENSRIHLADKFGGQGYATDKMFFEDPDYEKFLDDIAALTADPAEFEKKFLEINGIF